MENGSQLMGKDPTKEYKTRIKDLLKDNRAIVSEKSSSREPDCTKAQRTCKTPQGSQTHETIGKLQRAMTR